LDVKAVLSKVTSPPSPPGDQYTYEQRATGADTTVDRRARRTSSGDHHSRPVKAALPSDRSTTTHAFGTPIASRPAAVQHAPGLHAGAAGDISRRCR
jgi:hypothetical protein